MIHIFCYFVQSEQKWGERTTKGKKKRSLKVFALFAKMVVT